jgi:hypothetical protein
VLRDRFPLSVGAAFPFPHHNRMLSWYHRFVFCFPAFAANLLWVLNDYSSFYYVDYLKLDTGFASPPFSPSIGFSVLMMISCSCVVLRLLSIATAFNGAATFLLSPLVAFLSDRKASKNGGERKGMLVLFALLYSISQIPLVWWVLALAHTISSHH